KGQEGQNSGSFVSARSEFARTTGPRGSVSVASPNAGARRVGGGERGSQAVMPLEFERARARARTRSDRTALEQNWREVVNPHCIRQIRICANDRHRGS